MFKVYSNFWNRLDPREKSGRQPVNAVLEAVHSLKMVSSISNDKYGNMSVSPFIILLPMALIGLAVGGSSMQLTEHAGCGLIKRNLSISMSRMLSSSRLPVRSEIIQCTPAKRRYI